MSCVFSCLESEIVPSSFQSNRRRLVDARRRDVLRADRAHRGHGDRVGLLACIPAGPECEMASRILEPDLKGEILKTVVIEVDFIMTIGIETE